MFCKYFSKLTIQHGFTLIEVLVTVSIAGILIGLAVANFAGTISSTRLTTSANDLLASLNLARSEAVKRGRNVVIRRRETNWEGGWEIFVDISRNGANADQFNDDGDSTLCEANEDCVLRVFSALPPNLTLRGANNLADYIRYTPSGISNYLTDGLSKNENDYFILCDALKTNSSGSPQANAARAIIVSTVGRARLALDTDANGIPNLVSGNVTSCIPG